MQRFPACRFYNLDKIDYCGTTKNLDAIANAPNYTFVKVRALLGRTTWSAQGSITSPDLVAFLLRDKHVDTIMHFAAQSHVGTPPARPRPPPHAALCPDHDSSLQRFLNTIDRSFESSFDFTHDNVLGTHVLLEAARVRASRAVAAALLILIVRSVTGRAPVARSTASSASST